MTIDSHFREPLPIHPENSSSNASHYSRMGKSCLFENHAAIPGGFRIEVAWVDSDEIIIPQTAQKIWGCTGGFSWLKETEEEVWFWTQSLALSLNLTRRMGKLRLCHEIGMEHALRILYFYGFLEEGGFMLHASGVVRERHAHVFTGPSGAGKTTIVRLSENMTILSDEVVGIRVESGSAGPMACGTPFFSDWGRPGERVMAPLQALYFPIQARENRLVRLTAYETLTRLTPRIFTYTLISSKQAQLFNLACQLASGVPGYDFYFRPEPEIWRVIDGC